MSEAPHILTEEDGANSALMLAPDYVERITAYVQSIGSKGKGG